MVTDTYDPMSDVNWDDIEEIQPRDPVAEGTYTLIAREAEIASTKAGDGTNVKITWHHADPELEQSAQRVVDYVTWKQITDDRSRTAMGFTKLKIKRIFGEVPAQFGPDDFAANVVGRSVQAQLKQETYTRQDGTNGVSNKVAFYVE